MPDISPAEVDAFIAEHYPAMAASGVRCEEISEGLAVARWRHNPEALRPGNLISGPTQFELADAALWMLAFTVVGLEAMAVTMDLHITFLRPATGGDLLARAELLSAGRTRISGEVRLWVDGDDRGVSHAVGSYAPPRRSP